MEKPIYLRGHFIDLNDILRLARSEGKKLFKCDRVRVAPSVTQYHDGVIVIVSPEK